MDRPVDVGGVVEVATAKAALEEDAFQLDTRLKAKRVDGLFRDLEGQVSRRCGSSAGASAASSAGTSVAASGAAAGAPQAVKAKTRISSKPIRRSCRMLYSS